MKNFFKIYRKWFITIILMIFALTAFLILGSVHGKNFQWFYYFKNYDLETFIWPLIAMIVGGIGSITAGNFMQYSTRNNLASPFTMGILPAASMGSLIMRLLGVASLILSFFLALSIAFIILALVLALTKHEKKSEMIVIGLAIGMVAMGINFLLSWKLPSANLIFRWFANNKHYFNRQRIVLFGPIIIIASLILMIFRNQTKIYHRSPEKALTLGINNRALLFFNYFFVAIIGVSVVFVIGEIAFIGMAIPSITRMILKSDNLFKNIMLGIVVSLPLLFISYAIANAYIYNYQLLTTVISAPLFILVLLIRGFREK